MVEFSEQTPAEVRAAQQSGLEANPCAECEGDGEVECGTSSNDPDQRTHVDDCPRCCGTGNGTCPCCDNPVAFVVAGDGRCSECCVFAVMEEAEALEPRPRSFDEHGSYAGAA